MGRQNFIDSEINLLAVYMDLERCRHRKIDVLQNK